MSHCDVDCLLLLCLERSQVNWKGIFGKLDVLYLGKLLKSLFVSQVVYFSATFPYAMLLVLLVRGLFLPGALEGVQFYLLPDIQRIAEPQVLHETR